MGESSHIQCDILVAGAGFAGSITALALQHSGFTVCLLEKGSHPRFAIGESSTPIADMMLRRLSAKYRLPWLHAFSRYGSWHEHFPEVVCGLKRGFSFFKHYPGHDFSTDAQHSNELLVAASVDDSQSDTNWLRADFDRFLVEKVKQTGIVYIDRTEIISAQRNSAWTFHTLQEKESGIVRSSFFVDATGGGDVLARLFDVASSPAGFLTDSFAIFSHFDHVSRWTTLLEESGISTSDFPYDPDDSALHQILDEGWLWMLRFNNNRTSMGFALDCRQAPFQEMGTEEIWKMMANKYPTIGKIMESGVLASVPGKIIRSVRLQRKTERCFGGGWVALPHSAGFVDPLFSSGIAQSLLGIEKIVTILHDHWNSPEGLYRGLGEYEKGVFAELDLIDRLVAGCYQSMAHFELFNAWSMLYFTAIIACERQMMQGGLPGYYLGADDPFITESVKKSYENLMQIMKHKQPLPQEVRIFARRIREIIAPLNTAGLMEPSMKNMYHHTAARI